MAEDSRHVPDVARTLPDPESQVVVLDALEPLPQAAHRLEQGPSHRFEPPHVRGRQEQLRGPGGSETRGGAPALRVDVVIVGIEEIGLGALGHVQGGLRQRVRGEDVSFLEERDEVAGGPGDGGVQGGEPPGAIEDEGPDSGVPPGELIQPGIEPLEGDHPHLPAGEQLTDHALQGSLDGVPRALLHLENEGNRRKTARERVQPSLEVLARPLIPRVHPMPAHEGIGRLRRAECRDPGSALRLHRWHLAPRQGPQAS